MPDEFQSYPWQEAFIEATLAGKLFEVEFRVDRFPDKRRVWEELAVLEMLRLSRSGECHDPG